MRFAVRFSMKLVPFIMALYLACRYEIYVSHIIVCDKFVRIRRRKPKKMKENAKGKSDKTRAKEKKRQENVYRVNIYVCVYSFDSSH